MTPAPVPTVPELAQRFAQAAKPRAAWKVGVEHEKIGVLAENGAPVAYHGPRGIFELFRRLERDGWSPVYEKKHVIALERGPQKVTIEPGGQVELSGAPMATQDEIERELVHHLDELRARGAELGLAWLGVGFRPFGTLDDVEWVPKGRYAVMSAVLPAKGKHAHDMMKRTATVQANIDYQDEADAAAKLRAAMSVTSIVTAMFANSPIVEGRDTGYQSYRARAWLETDPARCGLLPLAFEDGDVFRRYTGWALDVPLLFLYRDGYQVAPDVTFRRYLQDGIDGQKPTLAEWDLHLSTLFPEVRIKQYIELRGADAGPLPMVLALPALWKGLLYDDDALLGATALTAGLGFADRLALRDAVPRLGLAAPVPGQGGARVLDLAREVVALATAGLRRVAPGEERALAPLDEIVATGRAPAEHVRDAWRAAGGDPAKLVRALAL